MYTNYFIPLHLAISSLSPLRANTHTLEPEASSSRCFSAAYRITSMTIKLSIWLRSATPIVAMVSPLARSHSLGQDCSSHRRSCSRRISRLEIGPPLLQRAAAAAAAAEGARSSLGLLLLLLPKALARLSASAQLLLYSARKKTLGGWILVLIEVQANYIKMGG